MRSTSAAAPSPMPTAKKVAHVGRRRVGNVVTPSAKVAIAMAKTMNGARCCSYQCAVWIT